MTSFKTRATPLLGIMTTMNEVRFLATDCTGMANKQQANKRSSPTRHHGNWRQSTTNERKVWPKRPIWQLTAQPTNERSGPRGRHGNWQHNQRKKGLAHNDWSMPSKLTTEQNRQQSNEKSGPRRCYKIRRQSKTNSKRMKSLAQDVAMTTDDKALMSQQRQSDWQVCSRKLTWLNHVKFDKT